MTKFGRQFRRGEKNQITKYEGERFTPIFPPLCFV